MRDRALSRRLFCAAATLLAAIVVMLGTALPAWAADAMTLTFVRHGESEANAAGVIDTSVPGPHLTDLGRQQAEAVADELAGNNYDGVYASSMIRTQETAEPLATRLHQDVVVLPGLREIDAGVFEGQSEDSGLGRIGYVLAPVAWTLGARFVPVLGSTDGNAFDARADDAVQTIYDSGDRNAVVFSHGATIMFWTMMNVDNPALGLVLSHPLDNTSVVMVTGNPEDGWTLENWDGVELAADPSLPTKLFVDVRNVVTAPQTAAYRVRRPARNAVTNKLSLQSVKGSADQPAAEAPKTTRRAKKTQKPNGTTNLTRGNKFHPGDTAATGDDTTGSDKGESRKVPSATQQTADVSDGASAGSEATGKSATDTDASGTDKKAA